MRLPLITLDQATDAWNSMLDKGTYDASGIVLDYATGQDEDEAILSEIELMDVSEHLLDIQTKYGDIGSSTAMGGKVDSDVVEAIYLPFSKIAEPRQLSNIGFWRWLSNVANSGAFWRFINWRYKEKKPINWGITTPGSIIEVYFYRAWLRGHKMVDDTLVDPLHYAKLGGSEVWRSQILRQDFGRDREFVKAFLDTIYDKSGQVVVGTTELRQKLIPALRAWTADATFTHLSYSENLEIIQRLRTEGI